MSILPVLFNPSSLGFVQNSVSQVGTETVLKAIGRPTAALMDKSASPEARKYSAAKELFYQSLCFLLFLTLVKAAKPFGYKTIKNIIENNLEKQFGKNSDQFIKTGFEKCPTLGEFETHLKTVKDTIEEMTKSGKAQEAIEEYKKANSFNVANGAVQLSSIASSVVALTIVAPLFSNVVLHPLMKLVGLNKDAEGAKQGH